MALSAQPENHDSWTLRSVHRCEKLASEHRCGRPLCVALVGTQNPQQNASQNKLYHLARCLADAGHDVTLIVPEDPINRNFPVIRGCKARFRCVEASSAIVEAIEKHRLLNHTSFDVVHVVGIGTRSLVSAGRPWRRPFYIQDYDEAMTTADGRSLLRRIYYGSLEILTRQRAHGVVVASRALERLLGKSRPDLGPRLLYLPIGYDPSFENGGRYLDAQLQSLIGKRSALVWVGTFQSGYGINELIDLAEALASRRANCLLLLVGGGPYFEKAKIIIQQKKLDKYVLLPGHQSMSDVQAYLRIATAYVLPFPPTRQNLFRCPTKLFQYIAYNRPIVTNRIGEVAETLGDAGFYYECGSAISMADACEQAIAAADSYDQSALVPSVLWSTRTHQYRTWLESNVH
jgi:glycosyltransferase involved in cell wall biosynthesis